jgi:predicted SnoaL-like aldol condensation-catalyzing enzyme
MKKIFFAAFAGLLFVSCDSKTEATSENKESSPEQKNRAAFDSISKAFQTGEITGIDSLVADDFVDHSDKGDVKGRDSLKAMITTMHNSLKEMKTETVNTAANGDYVYGWMRYSGTGDGSMGMPKGPYDFTSIELVKFKDGKASEHWAFMQMKDMMKMMGPQPGMEMNKMDTTKKKK